MAIFLDLPRIEFLLSCYGLRTLVPAFPARFFDHEPPPPLALVAFIEAGVLIFEHPLPSDAPRPQLFASPVHLFLLAPAPQRRYCLSQTPRANSPPPLPLPSAFPLLDPTINSDSQSVANPATSLLVLHGFLSLRTHVRYPF